MYVKIIDCGLVIIVIYVDDLILIRPSSNEIMHVKKFIGVELGVEDLGKLKYC